MIKNRRFNYPFRLGTTSYIIPDEIVPNAEYLAPIVDDIELVLFESQELSNLPDRAVINELKRIQNISDVGFSVHFPIDRKAAAPDLKERREFFESLRYIVNLVSPLEKLSYVLHLEGITTGEEQRFGQWLSNVQELFTWITLELPSFDISRLCIENLRYPPQYNIEVAKLYSCSYCLDIGHLWMYDEPLQAWWNRMKDRVKVIHLHGVTGGKDHQSLAVHRSPDELETCIKILTNYTGVCTLEIFNQDDLVSSMLTLENLWEKYCL